MSIAQEIAPPQHPQAPAYDVRDLTKDGESATLVLDGVAYNLRITRAGKLILTK